jgi:hypothetical protein
MSITLISPPNGSVIDSGESIIIEVSSSDYTAYLNGEDITSSLTVTQKGTIYRLTYAPSGGFFSGALIICKVVIPGESKSFYWNVSPYQDDPKNITGIFTSNEDITRRLAWCKLPGGEMSVIPTYHVENLPAQRWLFHPGVQDLDGCKVVEVENLGDVYARVLHGWITYSGESYYIYSDSAITEGLLQKAVVSTSPYRAYNYATLTAVPKNGCPITVCIYERVGGTLGYYTVAEEVDEFTSTDGSRTHYCFYTSSGGCTHPGGIVDRYFTNHPCAAEGCPGYRASKARADVIWDKVDTTKPEFIYDPVEGVVYLNDVYEQSHSEKLGTLHSSGTTAYVNRLFPMKEVTSVTANSIPLSYVADLDTGIVSVTATDDYVGEEIYIDYTTVPYVTYEEEGTTDFRRVKISDQGEIDEDEGVVLVPAVTDPSYIVLTCLGRSGVELSTQTLTEPLIYGPVYTNGDSVITQAKVYTSDWRPCPFQELTISLANPTLEGTDSVMDGSLGSTDKRTANVRTNADGVARIVYTAPPNAEAVGYYVDESLIDTSTGLAELPTPIPYELLSDLHTFAIYNNDPYLGKVDADTSLGEVPWVTIGTPRSSSYYMNGRKELLFSVAADGSVSIVTPTLLTKDMKIATNGDMVHYLLYTVLPTEEAFCGLFLAIDRVITLVARIVESGKTVTSNLLQLRLTVPSYMKGEYALADAGVGEGKVMDSYTYYSIDPYSVDIDAPFDPSKLGVVFAVTDTVIEKLRVALPVSETIKTTDEGRYGSLRLMCMVRARTVNTLRVQFMVSCSHNSYLRVSLPVVERDVDEFEMDLTAGATNDYDVVLRGDLMLPGVPEED